MSSFVQAQNGAGAGTSFALSFSSAPASGDLICIFFFGAQVASITGGTAGSWTIENNVGSGTAAAFAKANGSNSFSVTLSSGSSPPVSLAEYVGPSGFVLDAAVFQTSTSCTESSFTPAGAGELAVLWAASGQGDAQAGPSGTGVVQRTFSSNVEAVGDILSTSTGSNQWSPGGSTCGCVTVTYDTWALVFKAGAAAAPLDPIGFGAEA